MAGNSSHYLIDRELQPWLNALPKISLSRETLAALRSVELPQDDEDPSIAAQVVGKQFIIPGPAGAPDVALFCYYPKHATGSMPCILHIHGGGYVAGNAELMKTANRSLAVQLGCVVASVEYRLAPETAFPGAVEDCYAALSWLFAHAAKLGVDPGRIGVKGESAGGGLAASLALLARDRGEYRVAFQHLIAPMIDDRTCVQAEPHPYAGAFMWTPQNNAFGWAALLGVPAGSDGISPYAAVARAEHLGELPPTFIAVGALDLFLEENLEYARRLSRAGVPVELHVYPGACHGFDFHPVAGIAVQARHDSMAALKRIFL